MNVLKYIVESCLLITKRWWFSGVSNGIPAISVHVLLIRPRKSIVAIDGPRGKYFRLSGSIVQCPDRQAVRFPADANIFCLLLGLHWHREFQIGERSIHFGEYGWIGAAVVSVVIFLC